MNDNELVMRRAAEGVPGLPDRATRVASWIGWHIGELTGVTVPAVVAVTATPWAWLVSGVVGAGWTVHEVRTAREQAAIKADRDLLAVTSPVASPAGGTVPAERSEVDDRDDTSDPTVVDVVEGDAADPAAGWTGAVSHTGTERAGGTR